jgi:hypothetical protein
VRACVCVCVVCVAHSCHISEVMAERVALVVPSTDKLTINEDFLQH